jgi:hypothetical protein
MKLKDIAESSGRWSTPSGTLETNAAVADGVLVDLSLGHVHHRSRGAMSGRKIFRLHQSASAGIRPRS